MYSKYVRCLIPNINRRISLSISPSIQITRALMGLDTLSTSVKNITIKTPLKHCLNSTVFIKDKGCLLSCACNNNHPKV